MIEENNDIIIANPMYDAVFKALMESKENARYFVSTILNEEVIDIDFKPQEYTYDKEIGTENKKETLKVIRLDFVAIIRAKNGKEKKVLIEVQQAQRAGDLARFGTYIGKNYIVEEIDSQTGNPLPIVAIYMLGYNLRDTKKIAVKIERSGVDILEKSDVELIDPIFDALTHDAYIIQVARLKREMFDDWEKCGDLLKLLTLFQQDFFIADNFLKKYPYPITDKNLKKMINTLEYAAVDPKVRRAMEEQRFAELDVFLWNRELEEYKNALAQKDNVIAAQARELEEIKRKYGILN